MECPLAYGTFFNPHRIGDPPPCDTVSDWEVPDQRVINGKKYVRLVKNTTDETWKAGRPVKVDGIDAIVEDGYRDGVPPGCWLRVVVRSRIYVLIERVEELLEKLNQKIEA